MRQTPTQRFASDISDRLLVITAGTGDGCAEFRQLDALLERDALRSAIEAEAPTLMVMDIGGIRALADVMELVELVVSALGEASRCVVLVKAEKLAHEAREQQPPQSDLVGVDRPTAQPLQGQAVEAAETNPEILYVGGRVLAYPGGWWRDVRDKVSARESGLLAERFGGGAVLRSGNWYPQRETPPLAATREQAAEECGGGGVLICRHHNYSLRGCTKEREGGCPYDHDHCHFCVEKGHTALACEQFRGSSAFPMDLNAHP